MVLLLIWVLLLIIVAAITLPILRLLGVVDWEWKYILAPIWVPLSAISAVILWFGVPIMLLSLLIVAITSGAPI